MNNSTVVRIDSQVVDIKGTQDLDQIMSNLDIVDDVMEHWVF